MLKAVLDQDVMPVLQSRLSEWNQKQQELRKQVQRVVQSEVIRNYQGKRPLRPEPRETVKKSEAATGRSEDTETVGSTDTAESITQRDTTAKAQAIGRKGSAETLILDLNDEPAPVTKPKPERGNRELASLLTDSIRRKAQELLEHGHSKLMKLQEAASHAAGMCCYFTHRILFSSLFGTFPY
jgi:hypothetical protein